MTKFFRIGFQMLFTPPTEHFDEKLFFKEAPFFETFLGCRANIYKFLLVSLQYDCRNRTPRVQMNLLTVKMMKKLRANNFLIFTKKTFVELTNVQSAYPEEHFEEKVLEKLFLTSVSGRCVSIIRTIENSSSGGLSKLYSTRPQEITKKKSVKKSFFYCFSLYSETFSHYWQEYGHGFTNSIPCVQINILRKFFLQNNSDKRLKWEIGRFFFCRFVTAALFVSSETF